MMRVFCHGGGENKGVVSRMFISKCSDKTIISSNSPPCDQENVFSCALLTSYIWLMSLFIREEPPDISLDVYYSGISVTVPKPFFRRMLLKTLDLNRNPYFIKLGYVLLDELIYNVYIQDSHRREVYKKKTTTTADSIHVLLFIHVHLLYQIIQFQEVLLHLMSHPCC